MKILCVSAATLLTLIAVPATAADWRFEPSANSGVDYTDNPRLIPGSSESYAGARVQLAAELSVQTEVTSLSLAPRFVYVRYPDDRLLDRNDAYVTLAASRQFETVSWAGSASYTRDTTITSEFGLTGLQEVNRDREAINVSLGPSWQVTERMQVAAQGYHLDSRYIDAERTGLFDYTYNAGSVSGSYVVTETVSMGVQMSVGELDVPEIGRRSRDIDASISVDWVLGDTWRTRLSYGPTRVESQTGDSQGEIYSASLEKKNLRSSARFSLERDVTPTGRGVLVKRDKIVLTADYAFTPRTSWSVTTQAIRTTDAIALGDGQPTTNDFLSLETSLRWRWLEHWSVLLTAGGRYVSYEAQSDDAEGFSVNLALAWNGQRRTISR